MLSKAGLPARDRSALQLGQKSFAAFKMKRGGFLQHGINSELSLILKLLEAMQLAKEEQLVKTLFFAWLYEIPHAQVIVSYNNKSNFISSLGIRPGLMTSRTHLGVLYKDLQNYGRFQQMYQLIVF